MMREMAAIPLAPSQRLRRPAARRHTQMMSAVITMPIEITR